MMCADCASIMTAVITFFFWYEDFKLCIFALLCGNLFIDNGTGNGTAVTIFSKTCLSEQDSTSAMALILLQDSGVGYYRLYMKLETFPDYY